jgi:hypothetical protein
MTNYDRVSVVVGVILIGAVILLVLDIPPRIFQFTPLGTPLTLQITGTWAVSVLLVGLACAGTEALVRTHPAVRRGIVRHTSVTWILPALATMALIAYQSQPGVHPLSSPLNWLIGLIVGGGVLAWLILMNYRVLDASGSVSAEPRSIRTALRLLAYPLSLILFAAIYRTRLRSLVTATAVAGVAFLLALSTLLEPERAEGTTNGAHPRRMILYAGVIGLMLGETTWALNYWQASAPTVGVMLMLLFYVLTGIVREYSKGTASRQTVAEFLVVAALGIWIVMRFGPG